MLFCSSTRHSAQTLWLSWATGGQLFSLYIYLPPQDEGSVYSRTMSRDRLVGESCPPVAHDSQSVCAVECLVDEQNNINDQGFIQNRVWGISIHL